jgi:hypothetical protein
LVSFVIPTFGSLEWDESHEVIGVVQKQGVLCYSPFVGGKLKPWNRPFYVKVDPVPSNAVDDGNDGREKSVAKLN